MKVQAISNTNFRNLNNVNFSGRKDKESGNTVTNAIRSKAAVVPVAVLLAANPATLNSAIPAQPLEGNRIEIAQSPDDPKIDGATYTAFPSVEETQQVHYPYDWAALGSKYRIKGTIPIKTDRGDGVLVLATSKKLENKYPKEKAGARKIFGEVFLVLNDDKTPSGKPVTNPNIDPIRVIRLIHPGESGGSSYRVTALMPVFKDLNNPNELADYMNLSFQLDDKGGKALDDALFGTNDNFIAVDQLDRNVPEGLPVHVLTKKEREYLEMSTGLNMLLLHILTSGGL